jgi:glycosyltransferase involved in cell wall biosynthesis
MQYKLLSIIVPVYNEGTFISHIIERVAKADSSGLQKELIIVNDGSTDNTNNMIHKTLRALPLNTMKVRYINKPSNKGKGAALRTGFLKSTGDIVIILDADLEYDPDDLPIMLEPFTRYGADAVYGSRFMGHRPHRILYFWHFMANKFLTTFSNLCNNLNFTDIETGYKAFKGDLIRTIAPRLRCRHFGFEPEITARLAKIKDIKLYEVGVSYSGRTYAQGKKIGLKDGIKAIWEILRYNIFER